MTSVGNLEREQPSSSTSHAAPRTAEASVAYEKLMEDLGKQQQGVTDGAPAAANTPAFTASGGDGHSHGEDGVNFTGTGEPDEDQNGAGKSNSTNQSEEIRQLIADR